ncbi:MAG: hypothetical protein Q4A82_03570 [Corynebacterium sp.]|nr:hypothetical protein [Corynebacterium sp.]
MDDEIRRDINVTVERIDKYKFLITNNEDYPVDEIDIRADWGEPRAYAWDNLWILGFTPWVIISVGESIIFNTPEAERFRQNVPFEISFDLLIPSPRGLNEITL